MAQVDRHAYLAFMVDDVTAVSCCISADPAETMRRQFYVRGEVYTYSDEYHPQHDAVMGTRATMHVLSKDSLPDPGRYRESHGVEHSIGAVTIEAGFAPVQHTDWEGGTYESPSAEGWVAVTAAQFDGLLSTLAANRASGFPPQVRLRLVGKDIPDSPGAWADIRDLVIPERRSYPIASFELSAVYSNSE